MANVASIESDRIEPAASIQGTVATDLLTGMIKGEDGRSMVMILDAAGVVRHEFKDMANRAAAVASQSGPVKQGRLTQGAAAVADEDQLVSFEVAGQEYAFPIAQVQEIVQLPANITHIRKPHRTCLVSSLYAIDFCRW